MKGKIMTGYMRVDEMMIDCHFHGLLQAMRSDDPDAQCVAYNSALALADVFRFTARRGNRFGRLHESDWQAIASVAEDTTIYGADRGRLLYSLMEYSREPPEAQSSFRSALRRLIDEENSDVAFAAICLSRQWRLFRRCHPAAMVQVLLNAHTMDCANFDDLDFYMPRMFASLPMTNAQIAQTAELLVDSDYFTRYISARCLLYVRERAKPHVQAIRALSLKANAPEADVAKEILVKLGEMTEAEAESEQKASA